MAQPRGRGGNRLGASERKHVVLLLWRRLDLTDLARPPLSRLSLSPPLFLSSERRAPSAGDRTEPNGTFAVVGGRRRCNSSSRRTRDSRRVVEDNIESNSTTTYAAILNPLQFQPPKCLGKGSKNIACGVKGQSDDIVADAPGVENFHGGAGELQCPHELLHFVMSDGVYERYIDIIHADLFSCAMYGICSSLKIGPQ